MPFENTNDLSFFYCSPQHKEALARMQYAVELRKVGALLIGEYGTGKTFVSNVLIRMCVEKKAIVIYVSNPRLTPMDFLREVNFQLGDVGLTQDASKTDFLRAFKERLKDYYEKNIKTVIVVDEAQSIQNQDLLEEIRLLLNVQEKDYILFTLILAGQPQLERVVDQLPQLKQRLSMRYTLSPLSFDETKEYIRHRLQIAGVKRGVFSDPAFEEIFSFSGGMPRSINNICDLALLSAYLKQDGQVDKETILHVAQELRESRKRELT